MPETSNGTIMPSPGIGIENLKKRLVLMYPGRHELKINNTGNKFEAVLNIHL